jgi:hypothetical protein
LEADLQSAVDRADAKERRWAFTLSNAGSYYFEDRCDLTQLDDIDWDAVNARNWQSCKETKQAEFLLEYCFPWTLVDRIGVCSREIFQRVADALPPHGHRPVVEIRPEWYY